MSGRQGTRRRTDRGRVRRRIGRAARRGFTLLETALTLVIIGVGVLAMVEAQSAFIQSNLWSSHAASANFLAQEVREFARNLPRHDPIRGLSEDSGWQFGAEPGEVTVDDIDDLDDLDGVRFGFGGNADGPINALGELIPEIGIDGEILINEQGGVEPMRGWAQEIVVEKVEPFDTSWVRADGYERVTDEDGFPALGRESFPVRVTIIVTYTPSVGEEMEMARVTWVAP